MALGVELCRPMCAFHAAHVQVKSKKIESGSPLRHFLFFYLLLFTCPYALSGMQTCSSSFSQWSCSRSARFGSAGLAAAPRSRPPAPREAVQDREMLQLHRLQAGAAALPFRFLPDRLALAGQRIRRHRAATESDDRSPPASFERGKLDLQIARLARPTAQEQADAHLPRLPVLAYPVGDRHRAVGRMLAEGEFRHRVLQSPRPDLDAMLVANLQETPQAPLAVPASLRSAILPASASIAPPSSPAARCRQDRRRPPTPAALRSSPAPRR